MTALPLEYDAVRRVCREVEGRDLGILDWEPREDYTPSPYEVGRYRLADGNRLTFALAVLPEKGSIEAAAHAGALAERLRPRCLAMSGVCAGHPKRVSYGDVVAASTTRASTYSATSRATPST